MAFQNIQFPVMKLIHGMTVARERPTSIISNFAKEFRVSRYNTTKVSYIFPGRNLTSTDYNTIRNFLESVGWERDAFYLTVPNIVTNLKVRLDGIPTANFVALTSNNSVAMVYLSDIKLKQVFNE